MKRHYLLGGLCATALTAAANHCSIAVSIDVNKRRVKVKDYNAQTRSYSFSQIKGVLW